MAQKKKIRIYYRAPSHVPLWKVIEECGFLKKRGLAGLNARHAENRRDKQKHD
jgi:hypothetical protein